MPRSSRAPGITRAPDRNLVLSVLRAWSARSTTRSMFYLVLPAPTLTAGFPELRCLSRMTLAFRPPPDYGSGDRAPRWVRPSGLRSAVLVLGRPTVGTVMGAVLVDGSAASCPAGLLPQCPHDPAAAAGSTSPGGPDDRCPQLRHLPTCPDRRCPLAAPPVLVDSADKQARMRGRPHRTRTATAGFPRSPAAAGRSLARAPRPAGCPGGCGTGHPGVRCPLLLPEPWPSVRTAAVRCRHCG
jgi:hypothetical protein